MPDSCTARIREVSEQLAHCPDDRLSVQLAEELRMLLHERVEQLRERVGLSLLARSRPQFDDDPANNRKH